MIRTVPRRRIGDTATSIPPHSQNFRAANEPHLIPRPFYRPEITLGEAAFMVAVVVGVVAAMNGVVVLVEALQSVAIALGLGK